MKTGFKISLVFLISIILTSVFAFLAFTSLFARIEKDFYNKRVVENKSQELLLVNRAFDSYLDLTEKILEEYLNHNFLRTVFLINQETEEIEKREELTYGLRSNIVGFQFVRIIDQDGRRVHFSSQITDERLRNQDKIVYYNWNEIEKPDQENNLLLTDGESRKIFLDEKNSRIVLSLPAYDTYDLFRGTALFYISIRGIQDYFFKQGLSVAFADTQIVQDAGLVINMPEELYLAVQEKLAGILQDVNTPHAELSSLAIDGNGQAYYLISRKSDLVFSTVVPQSALEFNNFIKVILIFIFFITVFLIAFLIFNIRSNPDEVIRQRIKKLQYHFLSEFIQNKERIEWDKWEKDLKARKKEIALEIKKGLRGRKAVEEEKLDKLIEKSWDELLEVILRRKPENNQSIDLNQLEKVIRRALTSVSIPVTVQGGAISVASPGTYRPPSRPSSGSVPVNVEDIEELDDVGEDVDFSTKGMKPVDVEDVEELDDVGDEDFSAKGMKPVDVEVVEELDDIGDVVELSTEDMKPVDVEDVEAQDDAADIDDLSSDDRNPVEVEVVDEIDGPDDVDELTGEEGEPSVAEESEGLDDIGELDETIADEAAQSESEELEELDGLEEVEEIPEEGPDERIEDIQAETRTLPEDIDTLESDLLPPEAIESSTVIDIDESAMHDIEEIEELDVVEAEELGEPEDLQILDDSPGVGLPVDGFKSQEPLMEMEENGQEHIENLPSGIEIISYQHFVKDIKQEITSLANQLTEKYSQKGAKGKELSMEDLIRTHSESLFENFNDVILKNIISEPEDKFFHFTEWGFNFDLYQKSFKIGMAGAYKALMQITRTFNALCGGLAALEGNELRILFGVGLDHDSSAKLSFDYDWDWLPQTVKSRKIIRIGNLRSSPFQERVEDDRKLAKINAVLYLPVAYKDQQHYMYLGFNALEKEIVKLLTKQGQNV